LRTWLFLFSHTACLEADGQLAVRASCVSTQRCQHCSDESHKPTRRRCQPADKNNGGRWGCRKANEHSGSLATTLAHSDPQDSYRLMFRRGLMRLRSQNDGGLLKIFAALASLTELRTIQAPPWHPSMNSKPTGPPTAEWLLTCLSRGRGDMTGVVPKKAFRDAEGEDVKRTSAGTRILTARHASTAAVSELQ
jgi:hypothetical protein